MKRLIYLMLALFAAGCTEEAKPGKTPYLHVAATSLTTADREIARRFTRQTGIRVHLFRIGGDSLLDHIAKNRYNSGFDVLITEDQRFVYALSRRRLLATIEGGRLFSMQIRQFNNSSHKWLAVAHDPLVVSSGTDSTGNCRYPSSGAAIMHAGIADVPRGLYPGLITGRPTSEAGENSLLVTRLSRLLADKELQKRSCWSYLQFNKRYESSFLSISEYQYSRNHEAAQRFIRYYFSCRNYVAISRNYQSTARNGWAGKRIKMLKIRRNQRFDR